MGTLVKVRNTILSVRCSSLKTSTVFPQSDMTTAIKDMSETIVQIIVVFLLIVLIQPTATSCDCKQRQKLVSNPYVNSCLFESTG